ncbi:hypothetical protein RvY_02454 [Ramazzottius varieornatus]|uniref:Peptidase S1 domain-containing protein n=1 Tax=Ramazzottius varieornatus TaxID=947166 RepID=A0A1D1UN45_RAMVA|nr:hypothetical protein RvY_02454 [Ramazzottius varieornatus]
MRKTRCKGDSGGPFMCRTPALLPVQWQLTALTSFGIGCASGFPGVYANVRRAMPFIVQVVYDDNRDGWLMDTTVPKYDPNVRYTANDYNVTMHDHDLDATTSGSQITVNTLLLVFLLFVPCLSFWRADHSSHVFHG